MKYCNTCNQTKPLTEFGNRKDTKSGKTSQCKKCLLDKHKQYYHANKETWMNSQSKYMQTEKYKKAKRTANLHASHMYPERKRAMDKVYYALKTGRLTKTVCEYRSWDIPCNEPKVQAHHDWGYEGINALKVKWLCERHHKIRHKEMKSEIKEKE